MVGIIVGFCILLPADIVLIKSIENPKFDLSVWYVVILSLRGFSIPFEDTFIKIL